MLILVFYRRKWYKKEKKPNLFFIFFWLESESHLTRVKFSNSSWLGSKIIKKLFFISRKFFGLKIISKKHFYLLLYFLLETMFKFIARRLKRWYMKAYSKSLFSCRIIGYTPNFQGICIFRRETRIKRENLKKVNSDEDNRLFVVFLFIIKFFFSIFKIDFFPKYQINFSKLFWFWNFRWWSTLWAEKLFLKVVHIGFKYPQKVVFVSLKKQQIVDYLRRYWLFSNFLSLFVFLSWKYIFPENLACIRLFCTKKYFLSLVSGFDVLKPM